METTQKFEVSTLSSREINNIIYFPDLVNPPSTNTFIDKTDDMDIDYPLEDENALEDFIITETQGFLVKLERELRPQPQFYALTGPGTHPGFYGAGRSETSDPVIEYIKSNCSPFKEKEEHKEVIVETESKAEKELKKERKQTKTKQTKITSFTIKSNRKSTNCEEKSDNNGETSQKNTTRKKSLSTAEPSSRKKIKTSSGAEDEAKLPEEENNSENKRDADKPKKSPGNNRGRPKGSLNKNKKPNSRKSEVDSSLSTSSLTSMSPNDSPTPKKRKNNRVSESSKKSTTSPTTPTTPTREGSLGMILNTDNFIVNTAATMNSAMAITSSP